MTAVRITERAEAALPRPLMPAARGRWRHAVPEAKGSVELRWHTPRLEPASTGGVRFTVIIPTTPGLDIETTLEHLRRVDYAADAFEIVQSIGYNPSRQRNLAAAQARGDVLYFLDDDSCVTPRLFREVAACISTTDAVAVGGPNVSPPFSSAFSRAVDLVWTSTIGVGAKRARYQAWGRSRPMSDAEVIGCNLAVQRQAFLEASGFDEGLWPQEENELVERLRQHHGLQRTAYLPNAQVLRPRPDGWSELITKLFGYGAARVQRFRRQRTPHPLLLFVPAMLVVYLVLLISLWLPSMVRAPHALPAASGILLPAMVYLALLACHALSLTMRRAVPRRSRLLSLLLVPLVHIAYGVGQVHGLMRWWADVRPRA